MAPSHDAPQGAKVPFWLAASRQAFRHLLKTRWKEEVLGLAKKRRIRPLWETLDLEDEGQTCSDYSADVQVPTEVKPFRLPWMPKEPVVAELIAIAGLAQALGSRQAVLKVLEPARFTHVVMPLIEDDVGDVAEALEAALPLWSGRLEREVDPDTAPKIILNFETQETPTRVVQSAKQLRSKIEAALRAGKPVILITPSAELPAALRAHVNDTLRCPPLSSELLVEILKVLHKNARRLGDEGMLKALPEDDRLARLTATQLQAAVRIPDTRALYARLDELTTKPVTPQGFTLEKVRGQKDAVSHLKRMLSDLRAWQSGKLAWSEATMSAVFFGPPGNGKTMLAEAFAGSAGIPFHVTSYSDCQRHGHQGDMLKALNEAFRAAEVSVPSVLFIDEIDSFSDRAREAQNEQYLRGVVNGLLMHLTRAAATPGLVLLAATNDLSIVDPAVIRPGRFDLKIPVGNPDRAGIRDILADHLHLEEPCAITEADLEDVSAELVGATGAAVAAKAREAMSRARSEGRSIARSDLLADLNRRDRQGRKAHLRRLAVHEAGHVVVTALSGLPPPLAVRIGGAGGLVENHALPFLTPETAEAILCELLAGRAAERLVLGSVSSGAGHGPDSDLARATSLALRMHTEWCFAPGAPIWQPSATLMSLGIPQSLRVAIEDRLIRAEAAAEEMLSAHMDELLTLTDLIVEKRELAGDELASVLEDLGLGKPDQDAAEKGPL